MSVPAEKLTDDDFNSNAMSADPNPEKALYWLSYYAEEIGNGYGRMKGAELECKTVRAIEYHKAKGTNKDREMTALFSAAYIDACDKYSDLCADWMRLSILREAAVLKIGVWQSKVKAGLEGHP